MRKLADPVRKVNAEVIGLDVHKRMIAYCRLGRGGHEIAGGSIRADRRSLTGFLDQAIGRRRTHVAFKASHSSLWVYGLLEERYGRERPHLAQAKKIHAIANSQERNGGDDAWWLACLTYEGRLPGAYVPPMEVLELRIATRERQAVSCPHSLYHSLS